MIGNHVLQFVVRQIDRREIAYAHRVVCCRCVVSIRSPSVVIFFCSFVVSTESMPPIITFLAPNCSSKLSSIEWYFVRSFALAARDEIYTFAFTFLRVLQPNQIYLFIKMVGG